MQKKLIKIGDVDLPRLVDSAWIDPAMFATHITSLTDGNPTKRDYKAYSRSVVEKYPEFADDEHGGFVSFKKQLTSCVRNRRYYGRKKGLKSPAKTQKAASLPKSSKKEPKPSGSGRTAEKEEEKLLAELKKIKDPTGVSVQHVSYLLEETFELRRSWIHEVDRQTTDILSEFPVLKNVNSILTEYKLLGHGLEKVEKNWQEFTAKILKMYETSVMPDDRIDGGDALDVDSDRAVLDTIPLLIKDLSTKFAQSCKQIIILKKVYESLDDLDSTYINAPRLVLFLEGDAIKTAFVVIAKQPIEIVDDDISLIKCLAVLLGSYYTFNVQHPSAYKNFLLFLDIKLAGAARPADVPVSVSKLFRKWRCVD